MRGRNVKMTEQQGRNQVTNRVSVHKKSQSSQVNFGLVNNLAATYSRGTYRTTTIGKTVFDGRVRNGNGSDHSFMATKKV